MVLDEAHKEIKLVRSTCSTSTNLSCPQQLYNVKEQMQVCKGAFPSLLVRCDMFFFLAIKNCYELIFLLKTEIFLKKLKITRRSQSMKIDHWKTISIPYFLE